jgi:hypothetical protein
MNTGKTFAALLGIILIASVHGCDRTKQYSLQDEVILVIKAGKDALSSDDRENLKKNNHPLLSQISDPNTGKLIRLFANLPSGSHKELLDTGLLKWKFAALDAQRQRVWRDIVQLNIDISAGQGGQANPNFSQAALQNADVGFAVIDLSDAKVKIVSWYILWPEGPPTWVTVVGAMHAGTQPYFAAHMTQLPSLKSKPESRLPS